MPAIMLVYIKVWLLCCALMVLSMVTLGGYTRLSNAGLSIVEWKPVTGISYPFTELSWQEEFIKYQQSPEYKYKNFNCSLREFKKIYFIEYAHRLLGRILGIVFIVPFFYFLYRGVFSDGFSRNLVGIFALGTVQSGAGWYMVKSGLSILPDVSQYRLVLHLLLALTIYGLLMWQYFSLSLVKPLQYKKWQMVFSIALLGMSVLQIASGALVAGLDAGLTYSTYPLMDGEMIPNGLFSLQPWYLNIFENITTVQFTHRNLALIILFLTILFSIAMLTSNPSKIAMVAVLCLIFVMFIQFILGILTLVNLVPFSLALLHQFCAIMLFTNLLFIVHLSTCKVYCLLRINLKY